MASSRSSKAVHPEVKRKPDDQDDDSSRGQYANVRSSELRVKGYVLIGGRACKIVELSSSKTGKHGSCKIHLIAIEAFTGRKRVAAHTSTEVVQVPLIGKRECRLLRIEGNDDDDADNDSGEAASARLVVEEKSAGGAAVAVGLCQDRAAELLRSARDHLRSVDDGGDVIVTIMTAMGEEAAVAVRRGRDRNN